MTKASSLMQLNGDPRVPPKNTNGICMNSGSYYLIVFLFYNPSKHDLHLDGSCHMSSYVTGWVRA
jgi:hypothetical protein